MTYCSYDLRIIDGRGDHKLKSSGVIYTKNDEERLEISHGNGRFNTT